MWLVDQMISRKLIVTVVTLEELSHGDVVFIQELGDGDVIVSTSILLG